MKHPEFSQEYDDEDEKESEFHDEDCRLHPDNRESAADLIGDEIDMIQRMLKEYQSLLLVAEKLEKGSPAETALFRILERVL